MREQDTRRRRSFNDRADDYRLARPAYPVEVYDVLALRCGLGPGCRVLEVGAGTGQATAALVARGAQVTAVEPGAELARHLVADLGGERLRVVGGDIEAAALPARAFDLVVSATAFHWVRPDVALPKLARCLRPGGWLAVWWTVFGDPQRRTEFRARLDRLYQRYLPAERRGPSFLPGPLLTDSWTATLEQGGWFGPTQVRVVRWVHRLTGTGARRLFGSFPNVNELPDRQRDEFLAAVAALVDDEGGGAVDDPYATVLYTAPSRGTAGLPPGPGT